MIKYKINYTNISYLPVACYVSIPLKSNTNTAEFYTELHLIRVVQFSLATYEQIYNCKHPIILK
jgi:hypothetical protein